MTIRFERDRDSWAFGFQFGDGSFLLALGRFDITVTRS